ncbi:MAG: glycosyltransferase family 2 protein [Thermoanaerobaculia bacterium]
MQEEEHSDGVREPIDVSVVMPCLNEAATLASCIAAARAALDSANLRGEIIVADNGSTDGSQQIATDHGAVVVNVREKGYGNALIGGIAAARGRFVVMGDADASYDFGHVPRFIEKLAEGFDLIVGNRFAGGVARGAMPWKNRYIGNPVLSALGRLLFKSPVSDFHCGLRGFRRDAFEVMDLRTGGMEFASEMIVKATLLGMRVAEVPTTLAPDGRNRAPHLRPWRDGWRHLRFMLLYSPDWLFLYPGISAILAGALVMALLIPGPLSVGQVTFDVHTLVFASAAMLIGFQSISFWALSSTFAERHALRPNSSRGMTLVDRMSVDAGIALGGTVLLAGLTASVLAVVYWGRRGFGGLDPVIVLRWVIPGATSMAIGIQLMLLSFFLGILRLDVRTQRAAPESHVAPLDS